VVEATADLRGPRTGIAHYVRVLHVIVAAEFKLKYAGSALGYVWSVVKPLSLFTIMYLVFGRVFNLDAISEYYGVALLMGIVLFSFFSDATSQGMVSVVHRESLLRRLRFPRIVIPIAATLTAAMTFAINLVVVAGFIVWEGIVPRVDWILLIPLLAELYLFGLGTALILATLFIWLRDMGQVWELAAQMLFYASPIIYPITYLPSWLQDVAFLFPLTQVLQDIRALVLYKDHTGITVTTTEATSEYWRLLPIAITLALFVLGLRLFKRNEPWFAERA
jgi:ABC-2 type transport system permease protein